MSLKGRVIHSPQARFVFIRRTISHLSVQYFPLKKEQLTLSIKFEGVYEALKLDYKFVVKKNLDEEFQKFYAEEEKNILRIKFLFPLLMKLN